MEIEIDGIIIQMDTSAPWIKIPNSAAPTTTSDVPSKAFLEELVKWAKITGSLNGCEVCWFIETLYSNAGLECPNLDPD